MLGEGRTTQVIRFRKKTKSRQDTAQKQLASHDIKAKEHMTVHKNNKDHRDQNDHDIGNLSCRLPSKNFTKI